MLSAGPIPHNSMHLLIITTDFVALSFHIPETGVCQPKVYGDQKSSSNAAG